MESDIHSYNFIVMKTYRKRADTQYYSIHMEEELISTGIIIKSRYTVLHIRIEGELISTGMLIEKRAS
jgi:hypothetical protein